MKRLFFILSLALFHLTFCAAQQGLHINELFEGHIIPQDRLIETRVRGKALAKYRLTFYRSLRFTASAEEVARLRRRVDEDSRGHFATGSERSEKKLASKTYTWHVQLSPQGGMNRFLCYQDIAYNNKKPSEVTVIYMEGTVSGIRQLEEIINKQ